MRPSSVLTARLFTHRQLINVRHILFTGTVPVFGMPDGSTTVRVPVRAVRLDAGCRSDPELDYMAGSHQLLFVCRHLIRNYRTGTHCQCFCLHSFCLNFEKNS